MIKTLFLVPIRDSRGRLFRRSTWDELERRLLDAFGGYTELPSVSGAWRAGDRVYQDQSRQYVVSLTSWRQLPAWLELIGWVRERFSQEAIYVEVAGVPEILEGG